MTNNLSVPPIFISDLSTAYNTTREVANIMINPIGVRVLIFA